MAVLNWIHVVAWDDMISYLGISRTGVFIGHRLCQLFTARLTRPGVVNLAFNMLTILMMGPALETLLGRNRFALLYVLCAWASLRDFWSSPRVPGTWRLAIRGPFTAFWSPK
jgi:membrane associated rhomboid family serine protease